MQKSDYLSEDDSSNATDESFREASWEAIKKQLGGNVSEEDKNQFEAMYSDTEKSLRSEWVNKLLDTVATFKKMHFDLPIPVFWSTEKAKEKLTKGQFTLRFRAIKPDDLDWLVLAKCDQNGKFTQTKFNSNDNYKALIAKHREISQHYQVVLSQNQQKNSPEESSSVKKSLNPLTVEEMIKQLEGLHTLRRLTNFDKDQLASLLEEARDFQSWGNKGKPTGATVSTPNKNPETIEKSLRDWWEETLKTLKFIIEKGEWERVQGFLSQKGAEQYLEEGKWAYRISIKNPNILILSYKKDGVVYDIHLVINKVSGTIRHGNYSNLQSLSSPLKMKWIIEDKNLKLATLENANQPNATNKKQDFPKEIKLAQEAAPSNQSEKQEQSLQEPKKPAYVSEHEYVDSSNLMEQPIHQPLENPYIRQISKEIKEKFNREMSEQDIKQFQSLYESTLENQFTWIRAVFNIFAALKSSPVLHTLSFCSKDEAETSLLIRERTHVWRFEKNFNGLVLSKFDEEKNISHQSCEFDENFALLVTEWEIYFKKALSQQANAQQVEDHPYVNVPPRPESTPEKEHEYVNVGPNNEMQFWASSTARKQENKNAPMEQDTSSQPSRPPGSSNSSS